MTAASSVISTSAVAPALCATISAVRRTRSWMSRCMAASKARIVPSITTESGMMLLRIPPWKLPTVTMEGARVTFTCRAAMVCSAVTTCAPTTMGSTPPHGTAPCVCRPRTTMRKLSALAMVPSGR